MPGYPAHQLRMTFAAIACLAAMASAPLAVTSLGEHGIALPGLSSAQKLMAMLDARSPGERTKGELTKTKVRRVAEVPRERALGKVFPPKPPLEQSPVERLAQVVVPAPPPAPTPLIPVAPAAAVDIISPATFLASVPLAAGSVIIGGSMLPPPSFATPQPTPPPPPPPGTASAVPEPGSWLTMLVGFGIIGSAMRRRPRAALARA